MNKVSQNEKIRCPNCGFIDSGNFCSHCGAELTSPTRGAFIDFIVSFLKISEIKAYLKIFFVILQSPSKNTISYSEQGDARLAFNFLGYSATIYFLVVGSKAWLTSASDLTATIIDTLLFVIQVSVSTPIFYALSSGKSPYKRTFRDYLILISFYWGFLITLISIVVGVLLLISRVVEFPVLLEFLVPLTLISIIPLSVYIIRVLKAFWGFSIGKVLLNLIISNSMASLAYYLFLLLFTIMFNIPIDY